MAEKHQCAQEVYVSWGHTKPCTVNATLREREPLLFGKMCEPEWWCHLHAPSQQAKKRIKPMSAATTKEIE